MCSKFLHILDPGHGGIDPQTGKYVTPGKRSPVWEDGTQYFEGVGNRDIVRYIENDLKELNIDHDFTVIPDDPRDVPLTARANKANDINRKRPTITWSIHSNGSNSESANGFEVFTSPGQTKSDQIADILFEEFFKEFPELKPRKDTSDGDKDKEAKFYILTETNGRAVLLESMFHTNENECKILMSEEGKKRVANAVVRSIVIVEHLAEIGKIKL